MEWETVIGLEVHVQLATCSKIFSGAATTFGAGPNTQACEIDLGFPGVLPVLNSDVVRMAIKLGLGIQGEITKRSIFARKNYFYPDLPKGYQISQQDLPIIRDGSLSILLEDDTVKHIRIARAHLEEDAGKSLHEDFSDMSGIDLNRAGMPLLEIVTHPDISSAKEAVIYLKNLHSLVRYLEICDGNLQEGSFRCDANVSVRRKGDKKLGTRIEIKNLNSFRFIERAINHEIERQITLLEEGQTFSQETRLYDPNKNETRPMRSKEEEHDYRYFPDPDLLPLIITEEQIDSVQQELPELPQAKLQRFMETYHLSHYDASLLVSSRSLADYFEAVVVASGNQAKLAANWVLGELSAALNESGTDIVASPVTAEQLGQLISRIADQTISGKIAKTVFDNLWKQEGTVDHIIDKQGLQQVTDFSAIEILIDQVLLANPSQVADYRAGKEKLFGFFVGQIMRASGGKINPQVLNTLLEKKLKN